MPNIKVPKKHPNKKLTKKQKIYIINILKQSKARYEKWMNTPEYHSCPENNDWWKHQYSKQIILINDAINKLRK